MIESHKRSWVVTLTHTFTGMIIAVATTQILSMLNPYTGWGIEVTFTGNLILTLILTVVSILRTFGVRRFYNWFFPWYDKKRGDK